MFVEYHDLVDVIPLHPLVTHVLGLSELLTFRVQGLEMTEINKASLVKESTRRRSWFVSDALVVLLVLITELDVTLGTLEGHAAPHTGWVHLAVLEHLTASKGMSTVKVR